MLHVKQIWVGPFSLLSHSSFFSLGAEFPQALEIMENLENHEKKFHAWKNHGI